MASFLGKITNRQIIFDVNVSIAGDGGTNPYTFSALLDTGAQTSMISEKAIRNVGLTAINWMPQSNNSFWKPRSHRVEI